MPPVDKPELDTAIRNATLKRSTRVHRPGAMVRSLRTRGGTYDHQGASQTDQREIVMESQTFLENGVEDDADADSSRVMRRRASKSERRCFKAWGYVPSVLKSLLLLFTVQCLLSQIFLLCYIAD